MACNCCTPAFCCPNGDPVKWTAVLSGAVTWGGSGNRFLGDIASSLLGTYILNPTTEQIGGAGKYYSIANNDISTLPSSVNTDWFGLPFDGRVWGYGGLGCLSGPAPSGNIAQMAKKAAANSSSGGYVTVQMAFCDVTSSVTGTNCTSDATGSWSNQSLSAFSATYTTGGTLVSYVSGSYRCTMSLTLNF